MEDKGMTARVSAFSRAFHYLNNETRIFEDSEAIKLLSREEYDAIVEHMANGISFFAPDYKGSKEEGLRWIVDQMLSPTPLGRAKFSEKSLQAAVRNGATQYLICAAGFDTFAYRKPEWADQLSIFEVDYPSTSIEKQERLKRAGVSIPKQVYFVQSDFSKVHWENTLKSLEVYDSNKITFCSFLGMIYYLSKEDFEAFLKAISDIVPRNSSIIFDYPGEHYFEEQTKHAQLAKASNEAMKSSYTYKELTRLLEQYHFQIIEHLDDQQITKQYFEIYNKANPNHRMKAQKNVCYCLAVKK